MTQDRSLTLFHVRGVPVRAHWTLLLIVPYLAVVLAVDFASVTSLAGVARSALVLPPLVWGVLLALGLFASVVVHELAHGVVARKLGGHVRSITLMLAGGVSQIAHLPRDPRREAAIAVVGPLASLAIGGALFGAWALASGAPADVRMALFYLGGTNITLGAFNLLPAFPMDGGRILRAALVAGRGPLRATILAAGIGSALAIGLAVAGIATSNIMMLLVAVFVYTGARAELVTERMRDALTGLHAADLLPREHAAPLIDETARFDAIVGRMHELDRIELIVVDAAHLPVGVIDVHDLANADLDERWSVTAGTLARRRHASHVAVSTETSANDALDFAEESGAEHLIVVDPGASPATAVRGLLAPADMTREAALHALARPMHPGAA